MTKKLLFSLFILSLFITPLSSSASLTPLPNPNQAQIDELLRQIAALQEQLRQLQGRSVVEWCHTFNSNLGVGARGYEVIALHQALNQEGFNVGIKPAMSESETFTESVAAAVSDFQLKYKNEILTPSGLASPTGYVGPATRAKLNQLYGCRPVTTNQPPVISEVSGPTTLRVGEMGTWTVRATDPENGVLNYSVIWGDEPENIPLAAAPSTAGPVQQTATFAHGYARAGTYQPIFHVTDNAGKSNRTSISVVVGQNSNSPITVLTPNGGEQWVTNSVKPITWNYTGATSATRVDLYLQPTMPPCPPGMGCIQVMPEPIILDKNIPARLTYNWIVATDIVNNPIPAGNYWVEVCPSGSEGPGDTGCDSSDDHFTIFPVADLQ
ncbi:MAG: peptidoglycan-binding protein [Patescibacteria group bacterium]